MEEVTPVLEEKERSASYKPVFVTEITDDLHFYVQDVETGESSGPAPGQGCLAGSWRLQPASRAPLFSGRLQPRGDAHPPDLVPLSGW